MATLEVLKFPDPRLRQYASPVSRVDEEVLQLCDDMLETMYKESGIGLAAIQVGVQIDVSEVRYQARVFINPEITEAEGEEELEEGCLSVPGFYESVTRAEKVTVHYLDKSGEQQSLALDGLMAVCIQHEIDHLDGKLFVDYISNLKRQRIRKKLEKSAKKLQETSIG
jgi:peptide deformylase